MILRILKATSASRNPAHVPDPIAEHVRQLEQLCLAECLHLLHIWDPDDINVRRWLNARGLPNYHRDKAIWAVLAHYHHRIQNLTAAKDAAA